MARVWTWQHFSDLSLMDFHNIIALREAVFVVEQACAYQDVDGYDPGAWHLLGCQAAQLVATARLLPPGTYHPNEVVLGRVVVARCVRGQGVGYELLDAFISFAAERFPDCMQSAGVQAHLVDFYQRVGFHTDGEIYLEDGIEHIRMCRYP